MRLSILLAILDITDLRLCPKLFVPPFARRCEVSPFLELGLGVQSDLQSYLSLKSYFPLIIGHYVKFQLGFINYIFYRLISDLLAFLYERCYWCMAHSHKASPYEARLFACNLIKASKALPLLNSAINSA